MVDKGFTVVEGATASCSSWDNADYYEYFIEECEYNVSCGPDHQPLNITEWRKQHPKK